MEVRAHRTIGAAPEALFAFLAEPDRHWELLGRRLEPLRGFDGERSRVRLRGPLGVRRTLSIRFAAATPPHELLGRVEAGRRASARGAGPRTVGSVRWSIRATGAGASEVELTARTEVAGWLDRLLLACGGARWLRGSLELALARLDARMRDGAVSPPRCAADAPDGRAACRRAPSPRGRGGS